MNTLIAALFVVFAMVVLTACAPPARSSRAEESKLYQPASQGMRSSTVLRQLKECWKPEVANPDQCVIAKGIAI
jgi:hypothetical protein